MKTCFVCGKEKPLDEFYVHKKMGDGHLGKCKECTRTQTKKRYHLLMADPEWHEREKARCREKDKRLKWKRRKPSPHENALRNKKSREKYPEKHKAAWMDARLPRPSGTHHHHWSYLPEHWKDVFCLSSLDHAKVHRYMIYDQERMMYRRRDGTLIDTREAAEAYYASLASLP